MIPILLISEMLVAGLYIAPSAFRPVHGGLVGEVCIARDGSTSCPVSPPLIISTPPPASQLRVAILVNGSDGLNGFDITLVANSSVLKPASVSIGTELLGVPTIIVKCIGGTGSECAPTDNEDTIHFAAASAMLSYSPTTGLLFTAIYNVTGTSYNTPIGFQTGCTGTSVSHGVCVTISNGSTLSLQETAQTAKFTDEPYFDLQPGFGVSSLTVDQGGTDSSLFLNVTSVNGFSGMVNISDSVFPNGPVLSVSPDSVSVSPVSPENVSAQVIVNVGGMVPPGSYELNFTATSGSLPPNTLVIPLMVPEKDFSIITDELLTFNVSASGLSTITVSSLHNFTGPVSLALAIPPGLDASLSSNSLSLIAGGSNSTTITMKSTIAGDYAVNITGTSGILSHIVTIYVTVLDFAMMAYNVRGLELLQVDQGTIGIEHVSFRSAPYNALYNVTIRITQIVVGKIASDGSSEPSTGISVLCNPTLINLTSFYTIVEPPIESSCQVNGNQVGNYTVTVVAVGGLVSHSVTFPVQVLSGHFIITSNDSLSILLVLQGSNATSFLTLTADNGFTGNVTLTTSVSPSGPIAVSNPATVQLSNTALSALTISTSTANSGDYNVTVKGTSGSTTYSLTIRVRIFGQPFFALVANPSQLSIARGNSADSAITLASFHNFAGTITLSITTPTQGLAASLSSFTVTLDPNSISSITLTVVVNDAATTGAQDVTVTATNGSLLQTLEIQITVVSSQPPPTPHAMVFISPQNVTSYASVPGRTITISVNVSDTPSLNAFSVILDYNSTILRPCTFLSQNCPTVDYSESVLGSTAIPVLFCIDGIKQPGSIADCSGIDHIGVISLSLVTPGTATPPIMEGSLFRVTFTVASLGLAQLHLYNATLSTASSTTAAPSPVQNLSTQDGYFTNIECPVRTGRPCKPPTVTISYSPQPAPRNMAVSFNTIVKENNIEATPLAYTWDWGDGTTQIQTSSTIVLIGMPVSHTFQASIFGLTSPCVSEGLCPVNLTVYDNETVSWTTTILVRIVGPQNETFAVHATPASLTLDQRGIGTSTVIVVRNGFDIFAELGVAVFPMGSGISLTRSGSTMGIAVGISTPPGTYELIVGATDGTLVSATTILVIVTGPPADFVIAVSPVTMSITAGSTNRSTITAGRVNWFVGNITLSTTISPATGLICALVPTVISLGGSTNSVLTCSGYLVGPYVVTVVGTGGSMSHGLDVTILVIQPTETVECGKDASCTIQANVTISDIRFAGNTIHFTASGPAGISGKANITIPITAVPRGDLLKVFVDNKQLSNSSVTIMLDPSHSYYYVNFTFTLHSPVAVDIQFTAPNLTPTAPNPTILGLSPGLFYGLVGTLLITLTSLAMIILRRRIGTGDQ